MMVTLANGFAARGHDVDLVLLRAEGSYLSEISAAVRVVSLNASGMIASIPALVRYLRVRDPHCVLSALNYVNVVAIASRMIARITGRLVISERTSLTGNAKYNTRFSDRIISRLMKLLYRKADATIVVATAIKHELVEQFSLAPQTIHMINNPIVSVALQGRALEPSGHDWLDHPSAPVILGAGRLAREKDFATLIRAFHLVEKQRDARLVIIGEGSGREALETLAAELGCARHVSLPGFADNPYAFMKRSGVFVLSSMVEGMPGSLIQAMACGTPVVSTDCHTGPREALEDGRWGKLVPVGDASALADAILQTLDAETQPAVKERAAAFNEEEAINRYLDVMLARCHASEPSRLH